MPTNRAHVSKVSALLLQNQGTFFLFSEKGRGDLLFPPTPASCAPEETWNVTKWFSVEYCKMVF